MKRHGRKARIGDITLVLSRIPSGPSKGCWEVATLNSAGTIVEWVMFETKLAASRDWRIGRLLVQIQRRPRELSVISLARRGSCPSVRRARSRRPL